ncbi:sulfite exporter TauE/SafE family protein [Croceimicrobium hydrocarbonivorans]|uniref:Probable membrane transporter protein n=1 Tax=Croceimicrobium hydrocarbonivorans TaxID=2761580 RepID=A0A7H0VFY9_9FLAO|nr:sulfite exporter TauE/SafE family protein [Croceimicrobium hydrocarbonivorans]QNR24637.1 sulfite exporter TauE/SafE family protein [Croceimicrobium hydrocarbonivorans]
MNEWWYYPLLFGGGFLAGIINTLAGNGSAITLSLLILSGMPANVANGTNRIGALVQTITAVLSLRRSPRTLFLFKDSAWFLVPAVIGSVLGAFLAVDVDPVVLKRIIGLIMLLLLGTMVYKPGKWARPTDTSKSHKTVLNWILIFAVAVYGGFLQMGIGIMLLSLLVLVAHYSLRDANIIKLVLAFLFVLPAFVVFVWNGHLEWVPGLLLAVGQGLGAWIGARYILFLPKANAIVRYTLIVILIISSVSLLGIVDAIRSLF